MSIFNFKTGLITASLLSAGVITTVTTADSANADTVVTVSQGDTLNKIAADNGTTAQKIGSDNGISNLNLIYVGEKFTIVSPESKPNPAKSEVIVSQVNSPESVQATQPVNSGSAADKMASRTGVSASTWEYIIERESGGNANIRNSSSGAFGLFQLLGHGEHDGMSIDEQVNMAVDVYNAQGLSAWAVMQ